MDARTRSPGRESAGLYEIGVAIARPLVRWAFRPVVSGGEHVPSMPFVLASNQVSNLDGIGLAYGLVPHRLRWMAKAELFRGPAIPVLRALGVFPVRRDRGDVAAIRTAVELLQAGESVALFPEG